MALVIRTTDGATENIEEDDIVLMVGPYSDEKPCTYIFTSDKKRFVAAESYDEFERRLSDIDDFALLTRPGSSPVRVRGSAVSRLREAIGTEAPAKSVLYVGQFHQAVMEDVEAVRKLIHAHGGRV